MSEITKEFLDELEEDFKKRYSNSKKIQSLEKKIKEGCATCEDAFQYSKEVGNLRKMVLHDNITEEILNGGYLGYSNALKLFDDVIHKNYELIDQYCQKAFTQVNKQASINLKGVSIEYDQDKTDGIIECAVKDKYEKTRGETEEAVVTNAKGYYDSSVRKNASFQYKSGLQPKIIRTAVGKTCKWCQNLAGTYDYSDVSDSGNDVFRRHRNCNCLVVFSPKKGDYQDVYSKNWMNEKEYREDRIKRIELLESKHDKPSPQERINKASFSIKQKTIKDAEQYASQFVDKERFGSFNGISYRGLSVDTAKNINEALRNVFDNYNIDKLASIKSCTKNSRLYKTVFKGDDKAYMAYNMHSGTLFINASACSDLNRVMDSIKESHDAVKRYIDNPGDFANYKNEIKEFLALCTPSGRDTVPDNLSEIVYHEMGHAFEETISRNVLYNEITNNRTAYDLFISGYARENVHEYLAESFVSYMKGENIIDPKLKEAFDASRR